MVSFLFKGDSQISSIAKFICVYSSFYAWFAEIGVFDGNLCLVFANPTLIHAFFCMTVVFYWLHIGKITGFHKGVKYFN